MNKKNTPKTIKPSCTRNIEQAIEYQVDGINMKKDLGRQFNIFRHAQVFLKTTPKHKIYSTGKLQIPEIDTRN